MKYPQFTCLPIAALALVAASAKAATSFAVDVFAAPSTTFGVDSVATLTSTEILAEDGLATFNVTFDITPTAGTGIVSNANGYWAVDDTNFSGTEAVSSIGNITVTNFDANGGAMTVADVSGLSFGFVNHQGAAGATDAGFISAGGNTGNWTDMNEGVPQFDGHTNGGVDTQVLAGGTGTIVTSIVLGATGTSGNWRINNIEVVGVTTVNPDGPAPADFAITEIVYAPDAEPDGAVTLTWRKTGAAFYIAKISTDMTDWEEDIGDSLTPDSDENPDDTEHITRTLALPPGEEYDTEAFFRIEEQEQ